MTDDKACVLGIYSNKVTDLGDVVICYIHTCQDCIRIGKFSFLIYDGMHPLIMTVCLASF